MDAVVAQIAEILFYLLPKMFKGFVPVVVVQHPIMFGIALVFLVTFWWLKGYFRQQLVLASEAARNTLLKGL